jgi:hypothetical protein
MAENKHATLDQLKMLAQRGKANSAALISELALLVADGFEASKHVGMTVTLPADKWDGRSQTIQDSFLVADSKYWYFQCGDADSFTDCCECGIKADNVTVDGEMTFRCEVTPETDLIVNILRLEVETSE